MSLARAWGSAGEARFSASRFAVPAGKGKRGMRAFSRDGDEICVRCTSGCTDLADFLCDAEDFDAVVAAGGDGTVATAAYLLAETGIPLGCRAGWGTLRRGRACS
mgnify:CR=1 FL=1